MQKESTFDVSVWFSRNLALLLINTHCVRKKYIDHDNTYRIPYPKTSYNTFLFFFQGSFLNLGQPIPYRDTPRTFLWIHFNSKFVNFFPNNSVSFQIVIVSFQKIPFFDCFGFFPWIISRFVVFFGCFVCVCFFALFLRRFCFVLALMLLSFWLFSVLFFFFFENLFCSFDCFCFIFRFVVCSCVL